MWLLMNDHLSGYPEQVRCDLPLVNSMVTLEVLSHLVTLYLFYYLYTSDTNSSLKISLIHNGTAILYIP